MKKYLLLLLFLCSANILFSQKYHSLLEIMKMMIDSKMTYDFAIINEKIECPDYSKNLNNHDCYRIETDSSITTKYITYTEETKPILEKAENFFQSNNIDSALVYYKMALATDSALYDVMTYIGQCYGIKKNIDSAMFWYQKAIDKNYIDYMAHWFLADIYFFDLYDLDKAIDEITIAQILNRNNKRIYNILAKIFDAAERDTTDWYFCPQIELKQIDDSNFTIRADEYWTSYLYAKALWKFEPGYKESMGVKKNELSTTEELECLVTLITVLNKTKKDVDSIPQLKILKEAAENKSVNGYIFYEIFLPQIPNIAYQLPKNEILKIKDYVLDVRHKVIK